MQMKDVILISSHFERIQLNFQKLYVMKMYYKKWTLAYSMILAAIVTANERKHTCILTDKEFGDLAMCGTSYVKTILGHMVNLKLIQIGTDKKGVRHIIADLEYLQKHQIGVEAATKEIFSDILKNFDSTNMTMH